MEHSLVSIKSSPSQICWWWNSWSAERGRSSKRIRTSKGGIQTRRGIPTLKDKPTQRKSNTKSKRRNKRKEEVLWKWQFPTCNGFIVYFWRYKVQIFEVSGGAARDTISYIEDCIAQLRPINLSLRLVCWRDLMTYIFLMIISGGQFVPIMASIMINSCTLRCACYPIAGMVSLSPTINAWKPSLFRPMASSI